MIKYSIRWGDKRGKPGLIIEPSQGDIWNLSELNSCDAEYILNCVLPSIEKVRNGELVQDPTRQDVYFLDTYEFGYDATLIDFGREKSIISYGYGKGSIEVPSEEVYNFMQEWGKYLREWKNSKPSL